MHVCHTVIISFFHVAHACADRNQAEKQPEKVCIVGSGNWGSAIARIIGENVKLFPEFDNNVNMW